MKLQTWLKLERGRGASLALQLEIKPPQVADWVSGDRQVPIVHMAAIEAFTRGEVTRQEMCPDGWQKIWPELVQEPADGAAPKNRVLSQSYPANSLCTVGLGPATAPANPPQIDNRHDFLELDFVARLEVAADKIRATRSE